MKDKAQEWIEDNWKYVTIAAGLIAIAWYIL